MTCRTVPGKAGLGGLVEGEPVAANPDVGSARYALPGVMRALLRALVVGGLVAVGWLLASGVGHADEDPGWPGTGLIHVADAQPSGDVAGFGGQATVRSIVDRTLSTTSVPRLSVQPALKAGILQPVVHAAGTAKPLTHVLAPLPRPLSAPTPHDNASWPATHPDTVTPAPSPAPATAPAPVAAPVLVAAPTTAHHVTPPTVLCSPVAPAAQPISVQPPPRDAPLAPLPAGPSGSTSSPCVIGSTSSGANTKNAPDFAVHDGQLPSGLLQPDGPLLGSGSDLPRSLSVPPSTPPD